MTTTNPEIRAGWRYWPRYRLRENDALQDLLTADQSAVSRLIRLVCDRGPTTTGWGRFIDDCFSEHRGSQTVGWFHWTASAANGLLQAIASDLRCPGPATIRDAARAGNWSIESESHRAWWFALAREPWAIELQVDRWLARYGRPAWLCAARQGWTTWRGLAICSRWANTSSAAVSRGGVIDRLVDDGASIEDVIDAYKRGSSTGDRRRQALRAQFSASEPMPLLAELSPGRWKAGGGGSSGESMLSIAVVGGLAWLALRLLK